MSFASLDSSFHPFIFLAPNFSNCLRYIPYPVAKRDVIRSVVLRVAFAVSAESLVNSATPVFDKELIPLLMLYEALTNCGAVVPANVLENLRASFEMVAMPSASIPNDLISPCALLSSL